MNHVGKFTKNNLYNTYYNILKGLFGLGRSGINFLTG